MRRRPGSHCVTAVPLYCCPQVYYGTPTTHEIKGMWCHPCYQVRRCLRTPPS
jgi:hypothetical protein